MGLFLIIALLAVIAVVYALVGAAVGQFNSRILGPLGKHFMTKRETRLREAAIKADRVRGSPALPRERWQAGAIDAAAAVLVGILAALAIGQSTVEEYSFDSGVQTHTEYSFSFWWFVLFTLLSYASFAVAARKGPRQQTPGQRFLGYHPQNANGSPLSTLDLMKRHALRVAAAPVALLDVVQGHGPRFLHDEWTATTTGTVVGDVTVAPPVTGQSGGGRPQAPTAPGVSLDKHDAPEVADPE